ncbi:hypothetical protein N7453_011493, partial [Penicillium expansum]
FPGENVDVSSLGAPLQYEFSQRKASNRFLKAALTERMASWSRTDLSARGIPSQNPINLYRRWGEGQFGLILTGNIMIAYDQLESPGNMIIDLENPSLQLATAAKKDGSLIVGQASHPGPRHGKVWRIRKPHPATEEEIRDIIHRFVHVAVYLQKVGYDGVQLHSAHGYPSSTPGISALSLESKLTRWNSKNMDLPPRSRRNYVRSLTAQTLTLLSCLVELMKLSPPSTNGSFRRNENDFSWNLQTLSLLLSSEPADM